MEISKEDLQKHLDPIKELLEERLLLLYSAEVSSFTDEELIKRYNATSDKNWKLPSNEDLDLLMIYENEMCYRGL